MDDAIGDTNASSIESPTTSQKRRASLSLKLDSIRPNVKNCQPSHHQQMYTPSTAMVLKVFQTTAPEIEEIVKDLQCNTSEVNATNSPELNIASSVFPGFPAAFNNPFEKAFENASIQPPRLPVSPLTEICKETESLNTPSISLSNVNPIKLIQDNSHLPSSHENKSTQDNSSFVDSNSSQSNDQNDAPPQVKRSRGRPPKHRTEISSANTSETMQDKKLLNKEKNRLAAMRHRESKKKWVVELSSRVRLLEDKNAILEAQLVTVQRTIRQLESEIKQLTKTSDTKFVMKGQ